MSGVPVRRAWIIADVLRDQPGGMRRHMELHARGLRDLGIEARTLYAEDGVHLGRALDSRLPGLRLLLGLLRKLRREDPDYINVHTLCAPAWIAAQRLGMIKGRVVVMSYASDERALDLLGPTDARWRGWLRRARLAPARLTFPRASGIWCVNREDVRYYATDYRVDPARLLLCPHAIEDAFFEPSGVERRPGQLLFVGTWIHRKGADVVSRAVTEVLRTVPYATFVAAGTLGEAAAVLRDFPVDVRDRVTVQSRLGDAELRALYGASALLLVPSRLEGLPFSLLEAMAQGCPALAAANSGMADAIEDSRTGWLLATFEPSAWSEAIVRLLRTPAHLTLVGDAARAAAEAFRVAPLTDRFLTWVSSLP